MDNCESYNAGNFGNDGSYDAGNSGNDGSFCVADLPCTVTEPRRFR